MTDIYDIFISIVKHLYSNMLIWFYIRVWIIKVEFILNLKVIKILSIIRLLLLYWNKNKKNINKDVTVKFIRKVKKQTYMLRFILIYCIFFLLYIKIFF